MSITYEEALSTLEAMFGAPWTRDTLDAVLRHEKGHMENTCDRILNHGSGSPQSLLDKLAANGDSTTTTLNADEELARSIQQQEQRRSMPTASTSSTNAAAAAATTVPSQKKKQRGTPTNLPKDFLRIPGYPHPSLAAERKSSAAVDDETLARMLQDELFSQELARNPDFAHLARGRSSAGNGRFPARRTSSAGTAAAGAAAAGTQEEGPKIIEKLSEMGDTARKRLAIFAAQFEQRMKNVNNNNNNNNNRPNAFQNIFKGATGAGGGSGSGGLSAMAPFNNSTAAAAERRGLLDDDDDQDVIEFEMRKNK